MLVHLLLLLQTPFWETKAPAEWTGDEIEILMSQSPWGSLTNQGNTVAFIASARPLREAEEQLFLRQDKTGEKKLDEDDYRAYIKENPNKHIVLAVRMQLTAGLSDSKEMTRMEKECFVRQGKKKIRAVGHFPPTPGDPYLRILFPRMPLTGLRVLSFGLYLPGVHKPFQDVEMEVKNLNYRGQLEY